MAEVHGNVGNVAWAGTGTLTAGTKVWNLSYEATVHDTTDFADGTARTFIAGLTGWTISVDANWDAANTITPGDTGTITCTAASGDTYVGGAIVQAMTPAVNVDDVNAITYNFQGTGVLTITL